jgi:hypothetical protein
VTEAEAKASALPTRNGQIEQEGGDPKVRAQRGTHQQDPPEFVR